MCLQQILVKQIWCLEFITLETQWKGNDLSSFIYYTNFKMNGLKLMSKKLLYTWREGKKRGWRVFDWRSTRSRRVIWTRGRVLSNP
jgi:hypothetical protein